MRPASIVAFAVAFFALSSVADKSAMFSGLSLRRETPRTVTGTVVEWNAGDSISVGRDHYPRSLPIALRHNTTYEGDIRSGVRVTVWYKNVGERRMVAEKVRVLDR